MPDIIVTDITNGTIVTDANGVRSWVGTGIFDVLMNAVDKNLETQYLNQRINGSDYAQVYASSIVAVLQQAVNYALQEKLVEAQIGDVEAGTLLKQEQQRLTYTQRVKEDKQTALLGLDDVVRGTNLVPEEIYQPKYE